MDQGKVDGAHNWGQRLQSLKRSSLYITLCAVVSLAVIVSHAMSIRVPTVIDPCTAEAYTLLRNVPEGSTVIIDTGYTNASRGESGCQMEAVLRMLMREKVKFVVYTWVEPQCAIIVQQAIDEINSERRLAHEPEYREWTDYLNLGYFPDGATMLQTVAANLRESLWKAKLAKDLSGRQRPVFESPVLHGIQKVSDLKLYVVLSPTNLMPTVVARVGPMLPVISMPIGVMFPEQFNYYKSGQLKGLVNGLVGAIQLETLMEEGIDSQGVPGGHAPGKPIAAGFPGQANYARGASYYFAFCCAIGLLLLAIAVGNVGMFLEQRRAGR